jgi:peptidoglycan-associated lipoprotein
MKMRNKSLFHIFIAIFLIVTVAGCTSRQKIEATLFGGGEETVDITASAIPGTSQDFSINVGDRIFFATNSTELDEDAKSILQRQSSWLELYPDINILMEGHADERGTREYNLALSARRAEVTKSYLENLGISGNRITTISYGKERPVAACGADACWSQNRRAVSAVVTIN